eukprot:TRINITY_DN3024_c5_g1_i1.p1 TRINITY_DN3024_c5_g1~~TRINITY_DN3024_c5_g1_i1.p1  ORF type:complete len:428 (+),score=143.95 TRINITY_DN3024_c5_g1_i1:41-1324(+)
MPSRVLTEKEQGKRFEVLLKDPSNKECFDCTERSPGWASTNLGIFLCLACAGKHREMGTHISKVKSVTMDKWESDMVSVMEYIGNARAEKMYRENVPFGWLKPIPGKDPRKLGKSINDTHQVRKFASADCEADLKEIYDLISLGVRAEGAWVPDKERKQMAKPTPKHAPPAAEAAQPVAAPQQPPPQQVQQPQVVAAPVPVPQTAAPVQPAPLLQQPPQQQQQQLFHQPPQQQQQQPPQQQMFQPQQQQPQQQQQQQPSCGDLLNFSKSDTSSANPFGDFIGAGNTQHRSDKCSILDAFAAPEIRPQQQQQQQQFGGPPPIGGHQQQQPQQFMNQMQQPPQMMNQQVGGFGGMMGNQPVNGMHQQQQHQQQHQQQQQWNAGGPPPIGSDQMQSQMRMQQHHYQLSGGGPPPIGSNGMQQVNSTPFGF